MERFRGKRALVTGSTRGIGHATAVRLLQEGAEVIVHGRSDRAVKQCVEALSQDFAGRVSGFAADLADRAQCKDLCSASGVVEILVNCAGVFEDRAIENIDEAHWHWNLEINTTAPWLLSKWLLPGLKARDGVIVNVSSDAGLLGYAGSVVYCASKGALIGLTRAMAVELAPHVRVLCVCPGPVDTDMMRETVAASADPQGVHTNWEAGPLLGRIAQPQEIAAAIAFAASADCSYATGNLIVVDGGTTTGRKVPVLS